MKAFRAWSVVLVPGETAHPGQKCCGVRSDMPILLPAHHPLSIRALPPEAWLRFGGSGQPWWGETALGFEVFFPNSSSFGVVRHDVAVGMELIRSAVCWMCQKTGWRGRDPASFGGTPKSTALPGRVLLVPPCKTVFCATGTAQM